MSELKEIDREKLADLLAKVQSATGPDRDLEYGLVALGYGEDEALLHEIHGIDLYRVTSSIDAALALVEKVLPLALRSITERGKDWIASVVIVDEVDPEFVADDYEATGKTAPLAILTALLSSLKAST